MEIVGWARPTALDDMFEFGIAEHYVVYFKTAYVR
jgi:hypothetical protein